MVEGLDEHTASLSRLSRNLTFDKCHSMLPYYIDRVPLVNSFYHRVAARVECCAESVKKIRLSLIS